MACACKGWGVLYVEGEKPCPEIILARRHSAIVMWWTITGVIFREPCVSLNQKGKGAPLLNESLASVGNTADDAVFFEFISDHLLV